MAYLFIYYNEGYIYQMIYIFSGEILFVGVGEIFLLSVLELINMCYIG